MKNKRLGEMLVETHVLSQEKVDEAVKLQANSGKRLGTVLLENGYISETQLISIKKPLILQWLRLFPNR